MKEHKLGAMEAKFAQLIWDNVPIASGELVKLCEGEFGWKKSTTYTMLRRLCERGIFKNADGAVTAVKTRAEFDALLSEEFVNETFGGSLPKFFAAFSMRTRLSESEIDELERLINSHKSEKAGEDGADD